MADQEGTEIGSTLGRRFVIQDVLARGQTATVYRAVDLDAGHPAVIKWLRATLAPDRSFCARFQQRGWAAAGIVHPSLVRVRAVGEEGGRPYVAMDFVNGIPLSKRLRDGPVPPDAAREIATQVADTLGVLHRRGIVHRSVSTESIMLVGGHRAVLLLPSPEGPAKRGPRGWRGRLARRRIFPFASIAPELSLGQRAADAQSDVYALGTVLYEMLAGEPPFARAGASDAARMVARLTEAPVPPSTRRPGIPPDLDAVALKAIQPQPEDRFGSVAELASALRASQRRRYGHLWTTAVALAAVAASAFLLFSAG